MTVRRFVLKVYEHFRPLAVPLYRELINEGEIYPGDVAYALYSVLGIRHKIVGDVLVGPYKIGEIDLRKLGYKGRGRFSHECDYLISYLIGNFLNLFDTDDVRYTIMGYSIELARKIANPNKLKRYLKREYAFSPIFPQIDYREEPFELYVRVKYEKPIARTMGTAGSILLYSTANAREIANGRTIVDHYVDYDDEYTLVGVFEYVRSFIIFP